MQMADVCIKGLELRMVSIYLNTWKTNSVIITSELHLKLNKIINKKLTPYCIEYIVAAF